MKYTQQRAIIGNRHFVRSSEIRDQWALPGGGSMDTAGLKREAANRRLSFRIDNHYPVHYNEKNRDK